MDSAPGYGPGFSVRVRFLLGVPAMNRHYTYQAHGIAYIVDLCTAAIKYKVSKVGNGFHRFIWWISSSG